MNMNNLPPGVTDNDIETKTQGDIMPNLQMGDITITDDGENGFSFSCCGKFLGFVNKQGEIAVMEWIAEKRGYSVSNVSDDPREAGK